MECLKNAQKGIFKKCTERNVSKNARNGKFQINAWNGMYKNTQK